MDREAYRRGIQSLKTKIKELAEKQKKCKQVLRMPRKTEEDRKNVQVEVNQLIPPTQYVVGDVEWLQSRTAVRKFKISAYLNVYAEVRGKAPCHHPAGVLAYLPDYMHAARKDFEKACVTTVDLNLLPWRAGKSMLVK